MISISKALGLAILYVSFAFAANDGAISGTVKDPGGAPLYGACVQAQNAKSKISTIVFSDKQGRFRAANLPPGDYDVRVTATGFKADPRTGVAVGAGQSAPLDFAMQKGPVLWSDLNLYQGKKLMPEGKGKELLTSQCLACHGYQTRMAAPQRDRAAWVQAINYMRQSEHARLANHINDQDAETLVSFLDSTFGVESKLSRSAAEMPEYKATVRQPFTDESMKIVYVEYEMPGPNRHPFSAAPDKNGIVWMPFFGRANKIGRLDPATGAIQEFTVPNQDTAGIHSAVPAPDGTVWIGEQAGNRFGKWDPKTQTITEYKDTYQPGMEGLEDGGSKHTVRVDPSGKVWGTAVRSSLTAFDPKTREFTHFRDVQSPYGVEIDKQGNPWFAEFRDGGAIGKVDSKTGKVYKWNPPTPNGWPRRIEIDSNGIVWFAEYRGGKIARFDPKTEIFKEFQLPGPSPPPYGLGIDKNNFIWYSSDELDTLGRLDPKTGQVTEFPFPHSENMIKELFLDAQGRMWYGTPSNNKVGYFVPPSGS